MSTSTTQPYRVLRAGLFLTLLAASLPAQTPGTAPPAVPPPMPAGPELGGGLVSKLVPGELPPSTAPAARALWRKLCDATLPEDQEARSIRAFQLRLDLTIVNGLQRNDLKATYSYLSEAGTNRKFVKTQLTSGRTHVRGPRGDFLIDRDGSVTALVGRDFQEDRRQLDQTQNIARNFVALTDPARLRIARLRLLDTAPLAVTAAQGKQVQEALKGLEWLELWTPDLSGFDGGSPVPRLVSARLGVRPSTGYAELCLIESRAFDKDQDSTRPGPGAALLHLSRYKRKDGFRIPQFTYLYEADPESQVFASEETTSFWVFLEQSSLRSEFTAKDFLPPE